MEGKGSGLKILIGEGPSRKIRTLAQRNGWGQMFVYKQPAPYEGEPWGFDNGAFLDWRNGKAFDELRYLKALERAVMAGTPYLAVCPDLVAQGQRSLDFSVDWMAHRSIPQSWPWYLALQDGMTRESILPLLGMFSGLFLGGTDNFKLRAESWCDFAHDHGKRFHYARAGTESKIKHAIRIGADSIDSAFPLWRFDRISRMEYLISDWQREYLISDWQRMEPRLM